MFGWAVLHVYCRREVGRFSLDLVTFSESCPAECNHESMISGIFIKCLYSTYGQPEQNSEVKTHTL